MRNLNKQQQPANGEDRSHRASNGSVRLSDLLIMHSVKLVEESGPLEDSDAMLQAYHAEPNREQRLIERARILAQRLGLQQELKRWQDLSVYVWLALSLLVFLMAYGIAMALIGSGRSLNAVLAFLAALGMHFIALLFWLFSVLASFRARHGGLPSISLGNLFMRLLARLPIERNPHSDAMFKATRSLLQRERLLPWVFGFISHAIWAAAFLLIVAALWLAFSFQAYRLTWETTILDAEFFVNFVQLTGWLPSLIGFPIPDPDSILNPGAVNSNHRAWAFWLVGCIFVYGFLVRVLLALLSWIVLRRTRRALALDTSDPYFRKLLTRFDQMEQSKVVDPEQKPELPSKPEPLVMRPNSSSQAIIGFELPEDFPWPVTGLPDSVELHERIAGSGQERKLMLDKLVHLQPRQLLLVCNSSSSPDRGTERFLKAACSFSGACAVLLLSTKPTPQDTAQWVDWLSDSGLDHMQVLTDPSDASNWLGSAHDQTH